MTLQRLKGTLHLLQPPTLRPLTVETLKPRLAGRRNMARRARLQIERGSRCAQCGRLWTPEHGDVDHRIPRQCGGSDDDDNLQLLCHECHADKTRAEARAQA